MRNFLLAALTVIVVVAYIERDRLFPPPEVYVAPQPPKPPERRLAREGTFYMVDYVSKRTPKGVVGFERGREVRFLSVNKAKGMLLVSDGNYEIEVSPTQLTNDLDIADLVRRQDEDSQAQALAMIQQQRTTVEQARQQMDIEHARHLANYNTSNSIGGTNKLTQAPTQVGLWEPRVNYYGGYYGSPYYYLYR